MIPLLIVGEGLEKIAEDIWACSAGDGVKPFLALNIDSFLNKIRSF